MADQKKSLVAKLAEIMGDMGWIEKRGYNAFHKYKFVQESDLVDSIRGKLAGHGILLTTDVISVEMVPKGGDKDGWVTLVAMRMTFHDADSGETLAMSWNGSGEDKGDKGLYKAMTGGMKYFLLKTFLVPSGDDPEHDSNGDGKHIQKPKASNGDESELAQQIQNGRDLLQLTDQQWKQITAQHTTPESQHQELRRLWREKNS